MSDDLEERVARAMCASVEARVSDVNVVRFLGYDSVEAFIDAAWPNYVPEARAAIAVVLEEAADAVGEVGDHAAAGAYIDAIRAMIGKEEK